MNLLQTTDIKLGALMMSFHGMMIFTFVFTLGMGLATLRINLSKAPAAFLEGYRDGK